MLPRNTRSPRSIFTRFTLNSHRLSYVSKVPHPDKDFLKMTEPASNVMLVICSYTPVPPQAPAIEVSLDWCLELAASVDESALDMQVAHDVTRAKYIFETLAVHPTRKFAAAPTGKPERRSLNSPYFRLLKARARRVQHDAVKSPVSGLKLAVNPSCRAYLALSERREQKNNCHKDSKKLRALLCTMTEGQKTPVPVPQDAVRTAHDPVRTLRLQPFFVAQPVFSPA